MIQCCDCEHFHRDGAGNVQLSCNPFVNIKEPECVTKWQLIKLDTMVQSYQATLEMYKRLAPMQEKMFRHMEREMDDVDEADRWKEGYNDDDFDDDDEFDVRP